MLNSHCIYNHLNTANLKNNTGVKLISLLVIAAIVLQGCALLIPIRPCTFTVKDDDTQVKILGCKNSSGSKTDNLYSAADTKELNIKNKRGRATLTTDKDFYVISQYKKGYLPSSSIIYRSEFNTMKLADIGPPLFCDIILLADVASSTTDASGNTTPSSSFPPSLTIPAYLIGTLGWLDLFFGPWKTFPGTFDLPALTKFPTRDSAENRVYIREANISIEKHALVNYYFKTYKDYLDGNEQYYSSSPDEFKYRNSSLKDTLNTLLASWNFVDTTAGHLGFMYNSGYYIKCELTKVYLNTVKSLSSFTLECDWKLFNTTSDKALYDLPLTTPSKWGYIDNEDNTVNEYLKDAFEKGLTKFLSTMEIMVLLHQKTAVADTIKSWSTVHLNRSDTVLNLQEAVKSVVTVKTPEGHGSGCIVSNDGYVITNYHVIADNNGADVEVIFSSGDTTKAEYVRSNAEYDLALFKIKKPGPYKCLHPSLSKDITIGSEVFAIGTPEDIELGQTLTKGIISGQRKVGEKQIIQTDVSINPGNSGGALVTKDGTLLGIVNAKISGISIQGIGFAIPAHYIQDALKVDFK